MTGRPFWLRVYTKFKLFLATFCKNGANGFLLFAGCSLFLWILWLGSNFIQQLNNSSTPGSHFPCLMSVWIELLRGLQDVGLVRTAPSRIAFNAPKFYAFSPRESFMETFLWLYDFGIHSIPFKSLPCF